MNVSYFLESESVTIRQPVGRSVSQSILLGVESLLGFVTRFFVCVLGRSLFFVHIVYKSLDEGSTQGNRGTGRTQTYYHAASEILTV